MKDEIQKFLDLLKSAMETQDSNLLSDYQKKLENQLSLIKQDFNNSSSSTDNDLSNLIKQLESMIKIYDENHKVKIKFFNDFKKFVEDRKFK